MRMLALCLVAALCMAFAPAPFPQARRNRPRGDDLAQLQGMWQMVSHNGKSMKVEVEVKGNVWNHNSPSDRWTITLDPSARPKRIDLKAISPQAGSFRGIYKLEGGTFTYSLRMGAEKADRPRDFEITGPGPWVTVFRR